MRTLSTTAALLAGVLALGLACADEPSRVTVDWTDPAEFKGVKQDTCRNAIRPQEWLAQLARHVQTRGAGRIGDGERLEITFTDVQRAGICEPWRGPGADDIRVIKQTYPPRIDLRYVLRGADGEVIREGNEELRDIAFMQRGTTNSSDPLRYEKRLLDDWLRKQFPRSGKD